MKKIFVVSALMALFIPKVAFAQENEGAAAVGVPMPFVAVNTDPASAAMGDISLFRNAASYMFTDKMGHALVKAMPYAPANSTFVGGDFAFKIKDLVGIHASFVDNLETPYDIYDDWGEVTGSFKPNAMKAELGVAVKFAKYFSVGVEGMFARRTLAEGYSYNSFGGNAAFMVDVKGFNAAVGAKNLSMAVENSEGTKFMMPGSAFFDAGYTVNVKDTHYLTFAGEFEYFLNKTLAYGGGLKYDLKHVFHVAAGYHGGGVTIDHASLGLGFNIKGFTLDATVMGGVPQFDKNTVYGVVGLGYAF